MTAEQLLRLYPRGWRKRYGEEFLATVGDGALRFQQVVDIVSGAIDAWFSSDVRKSTTSPSQQGEAIMHSALKAACGRTQVRMTRRDGLIGAGVMLGVTFALASLGIFLKRSGSPDLGELLTSISFSVALVMSMPFTFMKGQPWRAQAVICGGTLLILTAATYLATLI
jgi:hypothetical protein